MANTETTKTKKRKGVRPIIGGTILTDERVTRQLPFVLFLVFLGLLLITNRFRSEKIIRRIEAVQDSIKELRSESVTNSVKLMDVSRPSEIIARVKEAELGLEEPQRPPQQIIINKKQKNKWK